MDPKGTNRLTEEISAIGVARTITVKVGKVPGKILTVELPTETATVQAALEAAELSDTKGYQIRVNANPAKLDALLQDGQSVLLIQEVQGN